MPPERVDRASLDPGIRSLLADLDPLITGSPMLRKLGGTVVAWGPGWAELEVPTDAETTNIAGTVHGSLIAAAADCAFETACNSYGRFAVAVSLNCQFTAAPRAGTILRAAAYEVSRSRSVASYRIDVTDALAPAPAPLVAWFQAVAHRSRHWHMGADRWPASWRERY